MYNDELQFEKDLIKALQQNGWTDGILNHPTERDLIQNWGKILFENNRQQDRLGDYPLTDGEMNQIIEQINGLKEPYKINGFINGRTISILRDNQDDKLHFGKEISLKIYDRQEIAAGQSRYQIAEQPIFDKRNALLNNRRGDIMLLINGMPLFHIELKKSNIPVSQATYQIQKYYHEGIFSNGIFQMVQIFVAMTPEETLYYANPGSYEKFNPAFYFHWEDFNNELINNWKDITRTLLSIPMAHQLIGFYTVADDTDSTLKVMRSYQYWAANKISDKIAKMDWLNPDTRGGYIWHTTGSGKTMTSFKSAQLIANSKDADKVIFLMDRIELGTQSLEEYQGFADDKDDVVGTSDTKELITKLKDIKNILIVTSIQKMSKIKDVVGHFTHDLEEINRKRIVFIVDECHRDTFGLMMADIKELFPRAIFFGFTGTPVLDEHKRKDSVTSDVFGNELHRYVIADGIRDNNVLGFDVYKVLTYEDLELRKAVALEKAKAKNESEIFASDIKNPIYMEFMNDKPMAGYIDDNGNRIRGIEDYIPSSQYNNIRHHSKVIESILKNWTRISRNNEFSGLFAVSSISEAIKYYRELKSNKANELFKFTILVDPNIDNDEDGAFKEDGLVEVLDDYNKMYDKHFSLTTYSTFKKDVCNRLAHKKPYSHISNDDKLGLLIVVDQLLTGFDSKWLNVLYLDKVLEFENIIQAFSRTNRIYNNQTKPFGIIKYYRKPYTMERNIEQALKVYSGDKPFQLFVPKLEENISKLNFAYGQIEDLFKLEGITDFSQIPEDKTLRRKFVKLYNEFNKYLCAAIIQGYIPKDDLEEIKPKEISSKVFDDNTSETTKDNILMENYVEQMTYESPLTKATIQAIQQRYLDINKESHKKEEDVPYDIDSSLIEIDDGKIDYDYMNNRFQKFLKVLSQANYTDSELEIALNNLHKSFASLPQEKQKYANMLIHDIESGDIVIESDRTFMDYVTEYEVKVNSDQIKSLFEIFGLNEQLLREFMSSPVTESNINEFGRFDELVKSVDINKAKVSLEKLYGKELKLYEVSFEIDEILRKFILEGGFDIKSLKN